MREATLVKVGTFTIVAGVLPWRTARGRVYRMPTDGLFFKVFIAQPIGSLTDGAYIARDDGETLYTASAFVVPARTYNAALALIGEGYATDPIHDAVVLAKKKSARRNAR